MIHNALTILMPTSDMVTALQKRFAVRVFDPAKKVSDTDLHTILESARLAPSSVGLEPWKFIVVTNPELRAKMRAAGYDQPKITDAAQVVVIARRTDAAALSSELIARTAKTQQKPPETFESLRQMAEGFIAGKPEGAVRDGWLAAQTYLPLGIMIATASLLGIDTGPMEGFDPAQIDEILGLREQNLSAVSLLALGYRGADPYAAVPKTRRAYEDVVEFVN